MDPAVVVTGIGLVTPLGIGTGETWQGFLQARSGIREIGLFDAGRYPSTRGGILPWSELHRLFSPREIARHEGGTLMLLAAAGEAFHQAGLHTPNPGDANRISLVLGSTLGGMPGATHYVRDLRSRGYRKARASALREMLGQNQAAEVCQRWGIAGESLVISDACTSGTNALGYALRLLRAGETERVLAGGYDPMSEFTFAGFHSLQAISPDVSRPFDRNRNGLLLGEGAALLLLEREEEARRRGAIPIARLAGYGESADAHHITRPDPSADGAVLAIQRALRDASLGTEEIGHINAHGTATPANDPMEAEAIRRTFGSRARNIPVTSNKAAIGHTLGAAGAIEAAITALSLRNQIIPPTLHHESLDPACEGIDVVANVSRPHSFRAALSHSFGFGGANAVAAFTTP